MALRKEMQEMQEWINQAEEDYLERDFTYKTPEELRKAVEELKVCAWTEHAVHFYPLRLWLNWYGSVPIPKSWAFQQAFTRHQVVKSSILYFFALSFSQPVKQFTFHMKSWDTFTVKCFPISLFNVYMCVIGQTLAASSFRIQVAEDRSSSWAS